MFGSLKDKIKGVLSSFSKKVKEEVEETPIEKKKKEVKIKVKETKKKEVKKEKHEKKSKKKELEEKVKEKQILEKIKEVEERIDEKTEEIEEVKEEIKAQEEKVEEKKGFFGKLFKKKEVEKPLEVQKEPETKVEEEKPGFFGKLREAVTTKTLSDDKFEELFLDLEMALFENNVAVEVVEKIKEDLRSKIVNQHVKRNEIDEIVINSLKTSIEEILETPKLDLISKAKEKKPYVICFLGINGAGKSTTIAKVAHLLQKNNLSCVMAAADTFRAAAIEQLGEWASKLDVKMISHEYGGDPAAVAFDAVKYAEAHHINVVLVDTAGRLHSNKNLMSELQKIIRVAKPDLKLFIGESITGNDCIEQAVEFDKAVGIDGIILSKVDVDEKGGTAVSISYVTKKPIMYIGVGQTLDDLEPFNKKKIMDNLGL